MTPNEAKRNIYRRCFNCKYYASAVWQNGCPLEEKAFCSNHRKWTDGEEDACRSFDYARWAVAKAVKESEETK